MITLTEVRSIPLFASVNDEHCQRIADKAADVYVRTGDWVAQEGEMPSFFVLLSGQLEISKLSGRRRIQLAVREPGAFLGEVPLMLGTPFFAAAQALAPSRLLRLSASDFMDLICEVPQLHDTLSADVIERIRGVQTMTAGPRELPILVGSRMDMACHNLAEFLTRNFLEFERFDPHNDHDRSHIPAAVLAANAYPALLLPDGRVCVQPTLRQTAEALDLHTVPDAQGYDVIIIGGGPSGLSAAVYGASEGLHTLMVECTAPGGQAGTSSRIENYLGFPTGLSGDDLGSRALSQALRFGAEILVTRLVTAITPGSGLHTMTLDGDDEIQTRAVIISTGVSYRSLTVPDIERFVGAGIYYGAARTEALTTRGQSIYLIGGGNSAGQAAMFFSNYAAQVTLLVRGGGLADSMSQYLIEQLASRSNIAVRTHSEIVGVAGHDHLEEVTIRDKITGTDERVPAGGVFIFIGADAQTEWLPAQIARDDRGYLLTGRDVRDLPHDGSCWTIDRDPFLLETSVPGIFAVGDVRHGSMKRVAAAVGEGSMAIAFTHQYLQSFSSLRQVVT